MAAWYEDLMNLDLNLGPVGPASPEVDSETGRSEEEPVNRDGWEAPMHNIREVLRQRTRQRWRWRRLHIPLTDTLRLVNSAGNGSAPGADSGLDGEDGGGTSQVGEASVAAEERSCEAVKNCENNVTTLENGAVAEGEDVEKTPTEGGSFFDCNVCLDLAREPVVTCCGHLFCWSCIYRWLHIHSDAKECPVCKGEVTLKNLTPIYGRGNHTHEPEEDSGIKIPARPSARRVESLRQTIQRTASSFPMEEMIRRLGARFELTRDFFQLPNTEVDTEPRSNILNRLMTSRALRREQTPAVAPEDVVDLTQDRPEITPRRLTPLTYRRGQSQRSAYGVTPATDRIVEAYLRRSPPVRSQDLQPSSVDDRDSFSSIGAVIHGESQTVDTAVEIDSLVSLSTSSSSRRRHDTRASDSGDSRAMRRRRLS